MEGTAPLHLLPATPLDAGFLFEVFAATREAELASLPLNEAGKSQFLRMQFAAQDRDYRTNYPAARFLVVHQAGRRIGRIYLDDRVDEIRIIDIALLPEHRARGIGSALLRSVLDEAAGSGRAVRLHVENTNPARRLYDRLGFVPVSDSGIYTLLEWLPPGPAPATAERSPS